MEQELENQFLVEQIEEISYCCRDCKSEDELNRLASIWIDECASSFRNWWFSQFIS